METTSFRFPAIAALAGRAPLGGQREVALGAFLVARLADDAAPERGLSEASRAERAALGRTWLSTLALPPAVRQSLTAAIDASALGPQAVAESLRALIVATTGMLDARSRTELERLATSLDRA
jgi:hypothetical protein